MSRAVAAMTGRRRGQKRAPKGVDIGGQFIGPKSIMRALVRMMVGGKDREAGKTRDVSTGRGSTVSMSTARKQAPSTVAGRRAVTGTGGSVASLGPAKAAKKAAPSFVRDAIARGDTSPAVARMTGKATKKAPARKAAAPRKPTNRYAGKSPAELVQAFHDLSYGEGALDDQTRQALRELDEELDRRDDAPELVVREDPRLRRLDVLLAGGMDFMQAWAEANAADEAQLERESRQRLLDVGRRPGQSRREMMREQYATHVYLQYLQAEEDTRGHMLTPEGRAKGIDPASLWSGNAARARKYASDELKEWWSQHGGRQNFTQWSAQFTGEKRLAEAARLAGSGRDYGV